MEVRALAWLGTLAALVVATPTARALWSEYRARQLALEGQRRLMATLNVDVVVPHQWVRSVMDDVRGTG